MNKLECLVADLCESYMMAQIEKGGLFHFSQDTQSIDATTKGVIKYLSMMSDNEIINEVRQLNKLIK